MMTRRATLGQSRHRAAAITRPLLILLWLTGCYDELEPPPECFESTEKPELDEERLMRTYRVGVSGYCATDRVNCVELWTGSREEDLHYSFYAKYPYISLIEEVPVSEGSPFSLCQLPESCELPRCECVTSADCESGAVCVGQKFFRTEN